MESRTHNATTTTETMAFTSVNDVPLLFVTKSILAAFFEDSRGMAANDARDCGFSLSSTRNSFITVFRVGAKTVDTLRQLAPRDAV